MSVGNDKLLLHTGEILRQRKGAFTSCLNGQFILLGGHITTLSSALALICVGDDWAVLLQTSWVVVQPGELTCALKNHNSFPDSAVNLLRDL